MKSKVVADELCSLMCVYLPCATEEIVLLLILILGGIFSLMAYPLALLQLLFPELLPVATCTGEAAAIGNVM